MKIQLQAEWYVKELSPKLIEELQSETLISWGEEDEDGEKHQYFGFALDDEGTSLVIQRWKKGYMIRFSSAYLPVDVEQGKIWIGPFQFSVPTFDTYFKEEKGGDAAHYYSVGSN